MVNVIEKAMKAVEDVRRQNRFNSARREHEQAVALETARMKCRGVLETCLEDLKGIIERQSTNIQEGEQMHTDTSNQEQIMWDAAIGYLLIRDAVYEMRTIQSADSVNEAYEALQTASYQMSKKKGIFFQFKKWNLPDTGKTFEYLASNEAVKRKADVLTKVFKQLKYSGDIESCIKAMEGEATDIYDSGRQGSSREKDWHEEALDSIPDDEPVKNSGVVDVHETIAPPPSV